LYAEGASSQIAVSPFAATDEENPMSIFKLITLGRAKALTQGEIEGNKVEDDALRYFG
jgi:hypothetical protein